MAPSSGQRLLPKALEALRTALSRSKAYLRERLAQQEPVAELVPVHAPAGRHPIPRLAAQRQLRARLGSQHYRLFSTLPAQLRFVSGRALNLVVTGGRAAGHAPSTFPVSSVSRALSRTTHAPFSSPLRPNLTGGALPRTAGGYGLGSGGLGAARHFSHTGSAQAHVVQNVHAAVRAFCLKGFTPLHDGTDAKGRLRFRAVGRTQGAAHDCSNNKRALDPWSAKGTSLDFKIAPTVTAIGHAAFSAENEEWATLTNEQVLPGLASDFARALGDLAAVHADLKRIATLGELPIACPDAATVRVRFPGCDADAVARLCEELGVTRGLIREDAAWCVDDNWSDARPGTADKDVEMALLFPWAPSEPDAAAYFEPNPAVPWPEGTGIEWHSMLDGENQAMPSTQSGSIVFVEDKSNLTSPRLLNDEGFESVSASESDEYTDAHQITSNRLRRTMTAETVRQSRTGYEGVEGIYRFLTELERADAR